MKYLLFILVAVLFSSCLTQRRCAEKFPPQIVTETETVKEIVYRDTTIYIHVPADTVYLTDTMYIYVTSQGYQTRLSELHTDLSWSTAQVVDGRLRHEIFQKEMEIERVIKNAIQDNSTNTVTTVVKTHEIPYVTKWHQFASIFTIIVLTLFFGYIVFRNAKNRIKT